MGCRISWELSDLRSLCPGVLTYELPLPSLRPGMSSLRSFCHLCRLPLSGFFLGASWVNPPIERNAIEFDGFERIKITITKNKLHSIIALANFTFELTNSKWFCVLRIFEESNWFSEAGHPTLRDNASSRLRLSNGESELERRPLATRRD